MCSVAAFDVLSRVVEQYASHGGSVQHVEATTDETAGGLQAALDLPVPLDGDAASVTPRAATMTDDGGLEVSFSGLDTATLPDVPGATVTDRSIRVAEAGLVMTVELAIDPDEDAAAVGAADAAPTGPNREPVTENDPATTEHTEGPADGTELEGAEAPDATTEAAEATTAEATEAPDATSEAPDATTDEASDLAARLETVRDDSVPPYEDIEYLQALYDACETFTEMSEHIQMDVVSETVRRYMIEAGIHDPTPYNTAAADATTTAEDDAGTDTAADEVSGDSDGTAAGADDVTGTADGGETAEDDGEPSPAGMEAPSTGERTAAADEAEVADEQLMADGVGLPEHLSVGDVVTAVVESVTVYEVQRRLGLGQRRTRELLEQLDLLDLVLHRVAADPGEVTRDDVVDRIRRRARA